MVVFSVLVVAGVRSRRDPQAHKRLMLLSTIAILSAAIACWPLAIMISQPLRLAISGTDAWLTFAHWAVALVS